MNKEVEIAISNRHVHLTKEVYELLFDGEVVKIKDLKQPGEFVTDKVVTIKTENGQIDNVKVLGPLRDYNQVEIAKSDALKLGINPPVRESGDLKDASSVTLVTNKGSVTINSAIIAQRHIHMTKEMADSLGLHNKQIVNVQVGAIKKGIIECYVKVKDRAYFELHIDKDDACAFLLNNMDIGRIIK